MMSMDDVVRQVDSLAGNVRCQEQKLAEMSKSQGVFEDNLLAANSSWLLEFQGKIEAQMLQINYSVKQALSDAAAASSSAATVAARLSQFEQERARDSEPAELKHDDNVGRVSLEMHGSTVGSTDASNGASPETRASGAPAELHASGAPSELHASGAPSELHANRESSELRALESQLEALDLRVASQLEDLHLRITNRGNQEEAEDVQVLDTAKTDLTWTGYEYQDRTREIDSKSKLSDMTCGAMVAYEFEHSVYDAAFFIGWLDASVLSSVMCAVGFLVNLFLQFAIVYILQDPTFSANPFNDDYRKKMQIWRQTEGHAFESVDRFTGASLMARVCAHDSTLTIASVQRDMQFRLNAYINGKGILICLVAQTLWTLHCACELRETREFVSTILRLPRIKRDGLDILVHDDGWHIKALSFTRVCIGLIVGSCRAFIAVLLLWYGCLWLAYTESIWDILLNASALGFVLGIDEVLFVVLSPKDVVSLIRTARPIRLRSAMSIEDKIFPVAFLVLVGVFLCLLNFTVLQNLIEEMRSQSDVLCGPDTDQNFVHGTNSLGRVVFARTPQVFTGENQDAQLNLQAEARLHAVQALVERTPEAVLLAEEIRLQKPPWAVTIQELLEEMHLATDMTMPQMAMQSQCQDLPWTYNKHQAPSTNTVAESVEDYRLGGYLYVVTGDDSYRSVKKCDEVKHLCTGAQTNLESQNVRFMCPITCGCANPLSGLWDLGSAEAGCPRPSCNNIISNIMVRTNSFKCETTEIAVLNNMPGWNLLLERLNRTGVLGEDYLRDLKLFGCGTIPILRTAGLADVVCGKAHPEGYLGLATMCPNTCRCKDSYPENPPIGSGEMLMCPVRSCNSDAQGTAAADPFGPGG